MGFLYANEHELAALQELPYIQRVVYLMGIRPYMDRQTNIVGIKRRISYQSLRETLYVGPIAGVKTGSPSHQQMKRAVKSLERAGLVKIQSTETHLILKCVLAELDKSVQKQADPRPTLKPDMNPMLSEPVESKCYDDSHRKADRVDITEADPPQKSEINYIVLLQKFEKFWASYPQKKAKQSAWEVFINLDPSEVLLSKIMTSIDKQITSNQQLKKLGHWTPPWKFPANWLAQQCWDDEVNTEVQPIINKGKRSAYKKQSSVDFFWESCKGGLNYNFDSE